MLELRPYQKEAIQSVAGGYRRGLRRMIVSHPTGSGKTIIFSTIAQGAVAKNSRVLILAHRDELLQQAEAKLLTVAPELGGCVGVVKAGRNEYENPVTIASVQSLHEKRLQKIIDDGAVWDIVIVDEAHHTGANSYQRILEMIGCKDEDTKIMTLGVTATPQRADDKDLGKTYEEVVHHVSLLEMIRQGYLCDLRAIAITLEDLDLSDVKVSHGDYVDSQTSEKLIEAEAPKHVRGAWSVHASDRQTIIFTPTILLAHEMANEFQKFGIAAVALSGETPLEERRQILRDFATGDIQVIANAQVLTEGYDEPSCDCIVIARPTKSQVLYQQMIGRGTRTFPGKEDCLVIDTVGATNRLDLMTVPKLFGLDKEAKEAAPEQTVLQLDGIRQERMVREGKIVAKQVELFDRAKLHWKVASPGRWILGGLERQSVLLQVQEDNTWTVERYEDLPGRRVAMDVLNDGLTLEYAMGVAEEYVRKNGSAILSNKDAAWRKAKASDGQREFMRKLGIVYESDINRGEASDLIDIALAAKRRKKAVA